jgi:cell division protein FtsL
MIRKKISKKLIFFGIISGIIAIFILTFYIWHQMESIRIGYEIGELEERISALEEEVQRLQAKKSALFSLDRVEKIAKQELKLVSPKEEQLIYEDFNPLP